MSTLLTDQIHDYFDDADHQQGAVDIAAVLRRVEERQVTLVDVAHIDETSAGSKNGWVAGLAAAAVAVLVVVGLVVTRSRDHEPALGTTPATNPPSLAPDEALSVAGEYLGRYNAGDVAGVLALFAPDATFSDRWVDGDDEYTLEFFEMLLEWNAAQGSQLIDPVCSEGQPRPEPLPTVPSANRPGSAGDEVTVVCEFGDAQATTQAAGRDPVPITLTLVISADGIHEWNRVIGLPDFVTCCDDFVRWVRAFRPDDLATIEFGAWTSVDEARASGDVTARLAEEWAATLEADDPDGSSTPESTEPPAVTTVELTSFDGAVVDAPTDLVTQEVTPSSIGDLRWTVLTGDAAADGYEIVRAPMGFAALDGEGTLVVSADAVEWRAVPSPFPGRLLTLTQDADRRYIVELETELGSTQLWESVDFVTWELDYDEATALSDLVAGPEFVKAVRWDQPWAKTPDGATFVKTSFSLDLEQIALRVGGEELQRQLDSGLVLDWPHWLPSASDERAGIVRTGVYEGGEQAGSSRATLFERPEPGHDPWSDVENRAKSFVEFGLTISGSPDDWNIEIEDTGTGETIGTVTGSIGEDDLSGTLSSLRAFPGLIRYLVIADGDAELVDPPWFDPTNHPDRGPVGFATTDEALLAYIEEGPAPTEVWRSIDGRTWQDLGTPAAWPDAPTPTTAQRDGVLLAWFGTSDGGFSFLRSEDGINWEPISQPPPGVGGLAVTEHGWLLTIVEALGLPRAETFEMWSSVDGNVWEPVDVGNLISDHIPPPVPLPTGGFRTYFTSAESPDLITWSRSSDGGLRTTWIVEVTPPSS